MSQYDRAKTGRFCGWLTRDIGIATVSRPFIIGRARRINNVRALVFNRLKNSLTDIVAHRLIYVRWLGCIAVFPSDRGKATSIDLHVCTRKMSLLFISWPWVRVQEDK